LKLIVGISKKLIFASFLFVNFIQPSKSVDFEKIHNLENYPSNNLSWSSKLY